MSTEVYGKSYMGNSAVKDMNANLIRIDNWITQAESNVYSSRKATSIEVVGHKISK